MKDLGVLNYFLDVEVVRSPEASSIRALGSGTESGGLFEGETGCPLTRRSLTSWVVFVGGFAVSWKTKKQHTISRSSTEAEYRSMAALTSELKWLKALLLDFCIQHSLPMTLFCDSQSALHIAQNPVFHESTKHKEVDCHYVRDAIRDGLLTTTHVSTAVQLADIFTKALGKEKFLYLLRKLGTTSLLAPT
ncbi:transmembrane signal receptor [Lithospermum erythrorhizon]|uniref:Transmembrane signal receptor n=1 Tax=Lithospermum erythrorhizon TaxID=34254 RepID=A0AAV3R0N5_LITER